jgi:NAD(P)-dependent dehydrogenase (short-subunit alcohol dehydrogenase family)
MTKQVILVTGASSGFGLMAARALATAGHIVYASMRETQGRNAAQVAAVAAWAAEQQVDLRTVELDVQSDTSSEAAVAHILADAGRLDVIVHNAGHMMFGPAEAFTPEQYIQQYDVNVLGTQRVNRAALPLLRKQGKGLLVWVGSSSTRGGTPPFLAPYFAAKAAMDALAVSYSTELALWGIETTIMVPGAFTKGTNHFAHSGAPADTARAAEYENGPYAGITDKALKGLASLEPADADPAEVAEAIVRWWIRRSASARSAFMSIRRRTGRKWSTPSRIGCAVKCIATSIWSSCSAHALPDNGFPDRRPARKIASANCLSRRMMKEGSGGKARARSDAGVPALRRCIGLGHGQAQRFSGEVDRDDGGDVGDAEPLAGHEHGLVEPGIQVSIEIRDTLVPALDQRGDLLIVVRPRNGAALQPGNGVADGFHDDGEAFLLHPPFPHRHQRLLSGRRAEQRRVGMRFLQIAQDRGHFADRGAVFEDQRGTTRRGLMRT